MPEAGCGSIQLLHADPELARGLDSRRAKEAGERIYARWFDVPRGRWLPSTSLANGTQPIGLLVVDGMLVREATVGDHPCAELLGPGDLLRAWDDVEAEVLLPRSIEWHALSSARLIVVDTALAVRAAQWPEILAALLDRSVRRAERLGVMQAITHLTRVDDRLLALLWALAERWGRVGTQGVRVPLGLPHRTLATLVGARRPSVTTAVTGLTRAGLIERVDDGWLLHGDPAEILSERLEGADRVPS
jgi:CRP/FNR family transcriptional regulator, cyclic AMP receptor protein